MVCRQRKPKKNCLLFPFTFFFIVVVAFLVVSCQKQGSEEACLHSGLPRQVEGWKVKALPLEYKGDDLFLYINGGAEIYHEYGFSKVIIQDYSDSHDRSITLEMYEMISSESAFGVYTYKRSQEGKDLALGNGGCLEEYYLNFWKGKFLVTLTGFERDERTRQGLIKIAQVVDALLPKTNGNPSLVSLLPEEDLKRLSIKYFRGSLAFFNNYRFFKQDIFSPEEGVRADYEAGHSVFIFKYSNVEKRSKVFSLAQQSFEQSPEYTEFKSLDANSIEVIGREEEGIYMTFYDRFILVIMGASSFSKIQEVVELIQASLAT